MQQMEREMAEREKEMQKREEEMKAWEKKYDEYHKELVKQLRADGYLNKEEKLKNFQMNDDRMKVNGKEVSNKDFNKYMKLKREYLKD